MAVAVLRSSRLRFFQLVNIKGRVFFTPDPGIPPALPPGTDETDYTVKRGDIVDNISQKVYRDPFLWWVVARTNSLRVPPIDLRVGASLRIPGERLVEQTIL